MKISIITASYNSAETIQETIESVLNQTYCEIEYIVVDGHSQDDTVAIIKKYESIFNGRMQWISEPDQGIYDALNKGIQLATGDIIGFLHSDDTLASASIIETIRQTFETTHADMVFGDLVYIDKMNPNKILRYWRSQPFKRPLLKRGWMPAHPTVFIKSNRYKQYGLFDTSFTISADYDFMLRILSDHTLNCVCIPEIITKMKAGGASNRNMRNIMIKSKEDYLALKKNGFKFAVGILFMKNLSKLSQFFVHKQ